MREPTRTLTPSVRTSMRLLGPLVVAGMATVAIGIGATGHFARETIVATANQRAADIAGVIAYAAETLPEAELQRFVGAAGQREDVRSILVIAGASGRVLAATRSEWRGQLLRQVLESLPLAEWVASVFAGAEPAQAYPAENAVAYLKPVVAAAGAAGSDTRRAVLVLLDIKASESQLQAVLLACGGLSLLLIIGVAVISLKQVRRTVLLPLARLSQMVTNGLEDLTGARPRDSESNELAVLESATEALLNVLAERRARLEAVIDMAADGVIVTDSAGRIETFNRAAERIFGYRLTEVAGRNISMLMPAQHAGTHDAHMQRYLDTGVAAIIGRGRQVQGRAKDGSDIPLELAISTVQVGGQRLFVGMVRDISERLSSAAALADSEVRFRSLFDSSPLGIVLIDPEGHCAAANRAMEILSGFSREQLAAQRFAELILLSDGEERARLADLAGSGHGHFGPIAAECRSDNGVLVPVRVSGFAVTGREGQPLMWALIEDVSERLRAQQSLRESEARFQNLADAAPVLIWMADESRGCTYFNRAWLEFTGRSLEEEFGDGWTVGLHADDTAECLATYQFHFDRREAFRMEYRLRRHDGEYRWILDQGQPRYSEDGIFQGYIGSCVDITERREAEEGLMVARDRLQLATLAGNLGVWDYDPAQDLLWWDEHMFALYGSNPDFFGFGLDDWWSCLHPDDVGVQTAVREALALRQSLDLEFRVRWPNGSIRHVKTAALIQRDESGRAVRMTGISYDLTSLRQAEAEAQENRRQLQAVIGSLDDIVLELDGNARLINCWSGNRDVCSSAPESLVGRSVVEALGAEFGAALAGQVTEVLATGKPHGFDCPMPRPGESGWINVKITRLLGSTAEPRAIAVIRDITERKQAEEALRENEERLRTLSDNLPNGAIYQFAMRSDGHGFFPYISAGIQRMFGVTPAEVLQDPVSLRGLVHADDQTQLAEAEGISARELSAFDHAFRLVGRDGGLRWVRCRSAPRRLADGTTLWDGVVLDETALKRAEDELRQAMEAADAATRTKSEFLANMSHEIRTPLNGVIGVTELLLDSSLTREQRENAEIIRISGQHLLGLVNGILDFSKIEAGRMELESLDFELADVLDEVLGLLDVKAQEKTLDLVYCIEADVPERLRGDPGRLRQILMNLAGNAVKFTEHGHVQIRVTRDADALDRLTLRFAVEDTGIGIPRERLGDLFNPFVQADSTTTRRFGGTGLGLAISRRLTELMGGAIGVTSDSGKGATFWFTAAFETTGVLAPPERSLAGRRAIVATESAVLREQLTEFLEHWGAEVSAVAVWPELVAAMRNDHGDRPLVLLDAVLAGGPGALAQRARGELAGMADIVVLAGTVPLKTEPTSSFAGWLIKPVRRGALKRLLDQVDREDVPVGVGENSAAVLTDQAPSADINRNLRVLLVDDHAINRIVGIRVLTRLGYSVDEAFDGAEAIEALTQNSYDLVLMDCQMPELDGLSATRLIRDPASGVRNHGIPIIAMTANALPGDRERCLTAGMNDYLTKPIEPVVLKRMLERWLGAGPEIPAAPKDYGEPAAVSAGNDETVRIFDREQLKARVMGDETLLEVLQAAFLEEAPGHIAQLETGVVNGDLEVVKRVAHVIKGAAGNLSANALQTAAAELEAAAAAGKQTHVADCAALLRNEYVRLEPLLKDSAAPPLAVGGTNVTL